MKVTLLIPTLNEIDGMRQIMPLIKREWVDQVLVVDGGSTDGTIEYVKENGYQLLIQKRKGMRMGYIEALDHVEGDVVITLSPDGNSVPELIPPLIEKMREGYDMVIVSRYLGGAKSYDDDLITAFGNWMFTSLINVLFGGHYTDAMVMFRAWRKEVINQLEINKIIKFPFWEEVIGVWVSWEPQLSVRCARRRLKCAEIPGDEPKRLGGKRKMRPLVTGSAVLFQILQDFLFWW
jgi:glycosyltransferase involved in cell wall biosynthesis